MRGFFVHGQVSGPEAEQHPECDHGKHKPNDAIPLDHLRTVADEHAQAEYRQHKVEIDDLCPGDQYDQDGGHKCGEIVFLQPTAQRMHQQVAE